MSKLTTLLNRVFVSVVFLLTGTRLAVARILPAPQSSQQPPSAKVFALTEAAWLELRAGGDGANQDTKSGDDKEPSKSSDDKKERSKSGDDKKEPPKSSDDSKEQSKGGDCDKGGSKSGDDKKDASKSGDCGPGGGDGDTGGSGG